MKRTSDILKHHHFHYLLLFIVALIPRLPGLGQFLTSDEKTNIYWAGSDVIHAFIHGEWQNTYWHFYPGVTMSWLDACGFGAQYLWDGLTGQPLPPFADFLYQDILHILVAIRLPYVLLTALFVPLVYALSRRLMPSTVALFGALLIALEPFFLAHSRVVHGDAPVAVFMTVSVLSLFIYFHESHPNPLSLREGKWRKLYSTRYLILSAICGGLAALTKAPGQFMAIFTILLTTIYAIMRWRESHQPLKLSSIITLLAPILIWGTVSLLTFIILWPAMWVAPFDTIEQMLAETFGKVNEGHLVYFFGQPMLDPGLWFYPYVIPFRLTPITLGGAIIALVMLFWPKTSSPTLRLFWLYVLTLFLFGQLSPKKQDRYLLPLFPMLNLLAALGWSGLIAPKLNRLKLTNRLGYALILTLHALPIISYYPYYLAYFNPLMGGPTRAAETTLMGWGEGMEQAATYLNNKPHAEQLYVASTPSQTFLPYFKGTGENFYTNDIAMRADYVIIYLAQRQRLAPSPEIVHYYEQLTPEYTVTIAGVPYAHIYPNEKRILTDIPPQAIPSNIGLGDLIRLAGYTVDDRRLTLYWHALAPIDPNYSISVRALSASGERLYQHDSWPMEGLLPTSQWRQGDYIADSHPLDFLDSDWKLTTQFEVVIYHTETGETLGSPITLPQDLP